MSVRWLSAVGFIVASVLFVAPGTSQAARRSDQAVEIHFARGSTCWSYRGTAWLFRGRFSAGQTLVIHARGQAMYGGEDGRIYTRIEPREDIQVRLIGDDEVRGVAEPDYDVPYTGRYEIYIGPHAIQGQPGTISICTR